MTGTFGEAGDGRQALSVVAATRPDVVLLDLYMPGVDGHGVLAALRDTPHPAAIVVLTSATDDEHLVRAMQGGATSYLLKTAPAGDVIYAIREAAGGTAALALATYGVRVHAVTMFPWGANSPRAHITNQRAVEALRRPPAPDPLHALSPREREVLHLIACGRSNRQIGRELTIGEQTVKTHVSSILTKLDLQDRVQAAIFAVRHQNDSGGYRPPTLGS